MIGQRRFPGNGSLNDGRGALRPEARGAFVFDGEFSAVEEFCGCVDGEVCAAAEA
jgi:hypothetical protein